MIDFERLDERGVLITGGASGIGLALARTFQERGARVCLADRDPARLAESAATLGVGSVVCDVTDPDAVEAALAQAWDTCGPIDVLCANAGVVRSAPLIEVSRDEAEWQFAVNVWGVLDCCQAFVRRLRREGRPGHLLLTGSEASLSHPDFVRPMQVGIYHMTKHSVLSMGDALRGELAPDGIGVSVLCPGPTPTDLAVTSEAARVAHLGGAAELRGPEADDDEAVDERSRDTRDVAEAALAGLRRGLFVIPTHPHIREDVQLRYREIERSFEGLS
ncbi:MAG: SDR family oxidoreductase [bacterium]|nr:SDR family oxidoreductase [bacterium]